MLLELIIWKYGQNELLSLCTDGVIIIGANFWEEDGKMGFLAQLGFYPVLLHSKPRTA